MSGLLESGRSVVKALWLPGRYCCRGLEKRDEERERVMFFHEYIVWLIRKCNLAVLFHSSV